MCRDEEGKDLLGKRTMDFKVSYLDAGLATSYFEGDAPSPSAGKSLLHLETHNIPLEDLTTLKY